MGYNIFIFACFVDFWLCNSEILNRRYRKRSIKRLVFHIKYGNEGFLWKHFWIYNLINQAIRLKNSVGKCIHIYFMSGGALFSVLTTKYFLLPHNLDNFRNHLIVPQFFFLFQNTNAFVIGCINVAHFSIVDSSCISEMPSYSLSVISCRNADGDEPIC